MACGISPRSWGTCAGDAVAGVAGSAANSAFDDIATSFGKVASAAVNWLWHQIGTATAVSLSGNGFGKVLAVVAAITGVVALALFVIQVMTAAIRRDPAGLSRAVKGLIIAFIAGGAAITVVNGLLSATDALSRGVVEAVTGKTLAGLGKAVLAGSGLTLATFGSAGLLIVSLGVLIAVVIVYAALLIRKVLLVTTAVFAPIAFAGSLADITVSWTKRWVEFTLALVFSKLVLVLIFITGYYVLIEGAGQAGHGATQQVTQVIAGMLILAVAGFAPWMAVKVVHFTGDHALALHAMGGAITSGAGSALDSGGLVARMATKAATGAAGAASGGGLGSTGAADAAGGFAAGGLFGMACSAWNNRNNRPPPGKPGGDGGGGDGFDPPDPSGGRGGGFNPSGPNGGGGGGSPRPGGTGGGAGRFDGGPPPPRVDATWTWADPSSRPAGSPRPPGDSTGADRRPDDNDPAGSS